MDSSKGKLDLSAAFAALRLRFEQTLPERAAKLQVILDVADTKAAELLPSVINEAHKLAGACGTFGFATLGSLARQIEQLAVAIKGKKAAEQLYSLSQLKHLLLEFDVAVNAALGAGQPNLNQQLATVAENTSIWLLLDNQQLITELTSQLEAFGHKVELFPDFDSCLRQLQQTAPAVLFADAELERGGSLFQQKLLLETLVKRHARLLVYSTLDSFELRIKAAEYRAAAFFISPLNIPDMVTSIGEMLEDSVGNTGRVFIVEEDKLLAEHYALVLNSMGITTQIGSRIRNIIDELTRFQPDLILMDMYLPEFSGAEVAGLIRQYKSLKRLPIVFLSSETNKTLQIKAMAQGADDFITKPIDDVQLAQAIKVRLTRSLQIKNLIEKDSLTSLIKHSAIKEAAELEYERSARSAKPLSIVMLDIDHFKKVNDNYGHAVGDLVITSLATLLRKRIRKTDKAGRYGGEEFMLVLPECPPDQARLLAEELLAAFATVQFNVNNLPFCCTFSAGVASVPATGISSAAQLLSAADDALYRAKRAGRNQIC
ncbi:diguanylate cyclase [Arsukibacterium sp.]|uniref:diguanylate cyclase n=1 Tax=Arsukibacterium sp. TaxID=1977258 RepID=UPI001BD5B47E|nr:diguanylate cyclase [Arsukibacterium sp.]